MTNYEIKRGKATSKVEPDIHDIDQELDRQREEAKRASKDKWNSPGSSWHKPSTSSQEPLDATTPSTTTS